MNKKPLSTYKLDALHLLVIEDSRAMRSLIIEILREVGIGRVSNAADGLAAQKLLDPSMNNAGNAGMFDEMANYDMVIADWMMEPVTGIELLRWMRIHKNETIRYMPFIMLTGYSDQKRIFEARDAGMTEFLAKPISVNSLVGHLLTVIDRPRKFIVSGNFVGPDRRRRSTPIDFPDRRNSNKS